MSTYYNPRIKWYHYHHFPHLFRGPPAGADANASASSFRSSILAISGAKLYWNSISIHIYIYIYSVYIYIVHIYITYSYIYIYYSVYIYHIVIYTYISYKDMIGSVRSKLSSFSPYTAGHMSFFH